MIKNIWKSLGISPDTTPEYLTLGELGMESLVSVGIQQTFESEYNLKLSTNMIKNLTVGMLKDFEKKGEQCVKLYLDRFNQTKAIFLRFKFLIPTESHTNLNGIKAGKPIYLMPAFETTFSAYEEFAKSFDRPVIGLNWTKDLNNFDNVKEITNYFVDLMKRLEPNGNYDIVGYFDGGIVTSKLFRKVSLNKAVIIDFITDDRYADQLTEDLTIDQMLTIISQVSYLYSIHIVNN